VDRQGHVDVMAVGSTSLDRLQRKPDIRTSSIGTMWQNKDTQTGHT